MILDRLNNAVDLAVSIENANTNNDYTSYDVVVLSPVPNSSAAGLKNLKELGKPMLLLKPSMMKNTVWNWGSPANTADAAMNVLEPTHPVFSNMTMENQGLTLFDQVTTNGVTMLTSWIAQPAPTYKVLATPMSNQQAESIVECDAGTEINGTILKEKFLMIGISEYSTAALSEAGVQLVENACRYLMGMEILSDVTDVKSNSYRAIQRGKCLSVWSEEEIASVGVYSLTGSLITYVNNHSHLPIQQGVYVVEIITEGGSKHYQKLLWN